MPRGDNGGRKTLLTPERHAAIIADVKTGLFATQVALRNNVSRYTLRNWVARGLEENAGEPYASFARDYIHADIEVERQTLEIIRAAGGDQIEKKFATKSYALENGEKGKAKEVQEETITRRGDWKAIAWFAEKRWPKRYGSRAEQRTDGGDDLPLPQLQESAQSRPTDLKELLLEPPQELEDILLDPEVRESLIRRLGGG